MGTVSVLQTNRGLWMDGGDGCASVNVLNVIELYP